MSNLSYFGYSEHAIGLPFWKNELHKYTPLLEFEHLNNSVLNEALKRDEYYPLCITQPFSDFKKQFVCGIKYQFAQKKKEKWEIVRFEHVMKEYPQFRNFMLELFTGTSEQLKDVYCGQFFNTIKKYNYHTFDKVTYTFFFRYFF